MNKRGFTLMEVLAVVLILAVIASLAIPGVRAARFEAKNSQAKSAAKQLITAINNYRLSSRGGDIAPSSLAGGPSSPFDSICGGAAGTEATGAGTGIPQQTVNMSITQLAPCGFISPKDFIDLPYTFYYKNFTGSPVSSSQIAAADSKLNGLVLIVVGNNAKAGKYYTERTKRAIYIDSRLIPLEYEQ